MFINFASGFYLFASSASLSDCYLAGAQYSRHAVAVSQGELDLDVDPPGSLSRDPDCPQPVVLAGAHHITDLIQSKCYSQQPLQQHTLSV